VKLRTTNNSIRLRLSQSDVKTFSESGMVEEHLQIGASQNESFTYRMISSEKTPVTSAMIEDNCLTVTVPADIAKQWSSTDEVGIKATQPAGGSATLSILIEKDFACLTPRAGDDDRDTFPHPDAANIC
jgi:hypothetical protein